MKPSFRLLLSIVALIIPTSLLAISRSDELYEVMKGVTKALRNAQEGVESTTLTYRSLPVSAIASFSYPRSWATKSVLQKTEGSYQFSKALQEALVAKLSFQPTVLKDGTVSYTVPLDPLFSRVSLPLIVQSADTPELRMLRVQKPVASDLAKPQEGLGYIQLCSFSASRQTGVKAQTTVFGTLDDVRERLRANVTPQSGTPFGVDYYVKNVYEYVVSDGELLGQPAVKFTMTAASQLYNVIPDRVQYEGLFTIKDGMVICAEVAAIEPQFPAYKSVFDAVVKSVVLKDAQTSSSSSVRSRTGTDARLKAEARLCARRKTCKSSSSASTLPPK